MAAGAGGMLLILATIIITITNRDGTKSTIRLPDGVETDVQTAPGAKVTIAQTENPVDAASVQTASDDRALAEWALSLPGSQNLKVEGRDDRDRVTTLADLPRGISRC